MKPLLFINKTSVLICVITLGFFACKKTSCDPAPPFYGYFRINILSKKTEKNYLKENNLKLDSFKIINKETGLTIKPTLDSNFNPKIYIFIIKDQFPDFYPSNGYSAIDLYGKEICKNYIFRYSEFKSDTLKICLKGNQNKENADCPIFYFETFKILNLKDSVLLNSTSPNDEIIKIYK
ncbi:MAG: hypothetical protein EAZ53_13050 [Bacteroidetes bacterium]|nr:MAG: hypothetical protein EAZ53_13050 [Bacteroidota bacterium]